ncbi:NAD(P)/FAD-dependent oxidoreductase [Micromonospora sp. HM5-17]|uniref:NAD(P)/FAD-dependent oxidoreductase n=1 Tax=Micromonospora sp. HM5-17 TaxID=2487710 RepID=UPI000F478575|nr:FAD-dependent oxidoreductase [Micromonospora sp. HM5-17]ROT29398.1 FAD-dependent oxidoreductase [Micromonospora sp. HM5-17]
MTPTIVVLGGGYTGIMNALVLARRTRRLRARVILVNPSDRFTERLRMHQIATGQTLTDYRIPALLEGSRVEFVQGWATRIDPQQREVSVAVPDGELTLRYDYLVYAIGSVADTATVPGMDAHGYTLNDRAEAERFAARLAELVHRGSGAVAVAGAGLTGVEAAAEIAERYPNLHVVLLGRNEPGTMMGAPARRYLRAALDRLGVEVRAGVEVTKVLPDAVELAGGELVPSDATLWTTGVVASPLAREAGLTVDDRDRVVVDATLASVSHPSVYAIGDAAAIRQGWGEIHGTCQSGVPSGVHAAESIARRLRGKQARPFRFGYLHQPVSLGRRDAVIQFTRPDDSPGRWYLTGRAAVTYKETFTSSPPKLYRLSQRITIPARALARTGGRANRVAVPR